MNSAGKAPSTESAVLPTLGIVGSAGAYGRWMRARIQARLGWRVLGSDPADPESLSADALIERCDVLLFSAPVRRTEGLIRDYAARAGTRAQRQLWLDLTSIKSAPVRAMLGSGAEVVGLHPMCAPPKAPSLKGRILVVCEARLDRHRAWLDALLDALEAECVRMSADEHDRCMAVVQNLVHAGNLASTLAAARLAERGALSAATLLACRTVGYEADFATAARMLSGKAELYIDILLGNPHAQEAISLLAAELASIGARIATSDAQGLRDEHFAPARAFLGDELLARGNYTFERLGYLLADLNDHHALSVHLVEDRPGSLRALLEIFEREAINIESAHSSRTPEGRVHFRFGFARETPTESVQRAADAIVRSGLGQIL